tara:strand:- start:11288 stop:11719 length:432 start_codon:yes stop_codon:yes gene_type:complete
MIEIRSPKTIAEWESYYQLRFTVLREPWAQPLGSEKDEGDKSAYHFALFENKELKAAGRLDKIDSHRFQVRYFCVHPLSVRKGFGRMLMNGIENFAFKNNSAKIILHARENAVTFYESLGYETVKESYLLFDEIQHYLMQKEL